MAISDYYAGLTENKTNAYIPIIEFSGNTECFSELPNKLKEQIND